MATTVSIYRRLSRLTLALVCSTVLVSMLFNSNFESHNVLADSIKETASRLGAQLSYSAGDAIKAGDLKRLDSICDHFAKDPYILSATVFDKHGKLIGQSEAAYLYQTSNQLDLSIPGLSKQKQPLITPIQGKDGRNLGFVRLTYLPQAAMAESHAHFHELGRQVLLMLLISCVLTWLIGRGLHRIEFRRYLEKSAQVDE